MEKYFDKFLENIKLTQSQREDAKTKYDGVCEKLHNYYYEDTEYNGSTKLLIGSYGKKTNIRPARDVDVIFKMPDEKFDQYNNASNGQSNLLQKIRSILEEKYPNTAIKVFEKVVVVEFSESKHNVELLPAFEQEDKKFKIPNSSQCGSWEIWNPRAEIDKINTSDIRNDGRTRRLVRMIKKWSERCSINLKSYIIENLSMKFLDDNNYKFTYTDVMLYDFFEFLKSEVDSRNLSYVETACKRAKKAIEYKQADKIIKAIAQWKKVFGNDFPGQKLLKEATTSEKYYAPKEEFIEDYYPVELDESQYVKINCKVTQDGWRPALLSNLRFLQKRLKLLFFIEETNVDEPFDVMWKVRNYGDEAKSSCDLRGQIWRDGGNRERTENTKYYGDHYVECYIIKNDKCITYDKLIIPIRN
ncbi:MAG: hypothetical protein IPH11_15385 [Ignavibacteriales bacterium]|nr:hypothetical protein [Ignavibacteriales bacterium]